MNSPSSRASVAAATRSTITSTRTTTNPATFRRALARWYAAAGRHDLEWRHTRDPYAVLVSEVMLQQTQVERVRPYYRAWLDRWPDAVALARADTADVIRAWAGLGYNRRAVNLQRAAAQSIRVHGGIPTAPAELQALPGVGPYTASAVACFATDAHVPVVDTNIARVIARARLGLATPKDATPTEVAAMAAGLLPDRHVRAHNLALMDFGATVCTARQPACGACPVSGHCAWRAGGSPSAHRATPPGAPRFETTARYARGRIVAALRVAVRPLEEPELAAMLPARHAGSTQAHLLALERDGLAARLAGGWVLPATAG